MSNAIWQRYPVTPGLHCVEMKDRLQERVMEETRGASTAVLVAYFQEASRRFWREVGRAYPGAVETASRETDKHPSGA